MTTLVPVILAGGEGSRLRPLSSKERPKQFLCFSKDSNDSLFQETVKRALKVAPPENIVIIASENYKQITLDQASKIDKTLCKNIIFEPCGRNTAAAISLAAIHAANNFNDPVLWVMPSDHIIKKSDILAEQVQKSLIAARSGKIVLFGITPTRPDSNFGYIMGSKASSIFGDLHKVAMFAEKPTGARLKMIMNYHTRWWNSGMFLMSARTLFCEMKRYNCAILKQASSSYSKRKCTKLGHFIDKNSYSHIESLPIDKVVMENSSNLLVNPVEIDWSDIGSWQALWELSQQDGRGTPLENFLEKISKAA